MLSMINLINSYKENRKTFLEILRKLNKKELIEMYSEITEYMNKITLKQNTEETIIKMIETKINILDNQLKNNKTFTTYKGKKPELTKEREKKLKKLIDNL